MMDAKLLKKENGSTLIEALVALSISVAVISALTVVVISSVSNSELTKNQNLATQYAQEGMETIRRVSLSESSPRFNSVQDGAYCMSDEDTSENEPLSPLTNPGSGRCGFNVANKFSREVDIDKTSTGCSGNTQVTVSVKWSDNKCESTSDPFCHDVTLRSCLSGYNPSQPESNPI